MPRRREVINLCVETEPSVVPVADHLRNEIWRLKHALHEKLGECPVCTEELNCRRCTLLL